MDLNSIIKNSDYANEQRNKTPKVSYWYFRFVEHFFENPQIIAMEQEPGGYEFLVILLKLYCKSLSNGGTLRIRANSTTDLNVLAKIVRHDMPKVERAIEYFIKNRIIEVVTEVDIENDRYFNMDMPYVQNMTGRSSNAADARRQSRNTNKGIGRQSELPAPREKYKQYGVFENVSLTEEQFDQLNSLYKNATMIVDRVSIHKKQHNKEYDDDYATVLKFALDDGIKVPDKKADSEKEYNRKLKLWETEASVGAYPPDEARELLGEKEYERLMKIAEENF